MFTRTDLPTFLIADIDAHISRTGVWVYAGTGVAAWTIAPAAPTPRAPDSQSYFIKVRGNAGALTINRSNADNFAHGTGLVSSITLQPGQSALIVPSAPNIWEVLFLASA